MKSIALNATQAKEITQFMAISKDSSNKNNNRLYCCITKEGDYIYSTNGKGMFSMPVPAYMEELEDGGYTLDGSILSSVGDDYLKGCARVIPSEKELKFYKARVAASQLVSFMSLVSDKSFDTDKIHFSDLVKIIGKSAQEVTVGCNEHDCCPITITFEHSPVKAVFMPCTITLL